MFRRLLLHYTASLVASFGLLMGLANAAPSKNETMSLLSAGQFSELDRQFTEVQTAYKRGAITDEELLDAFRSFYFTTPKLAGKFDEWIRLFPKSYVARLARGIYHKKVGQERRGGEIARNTSDAQFLGMETELKKASADFTASMRMDEKPLLSYLHEITVYQLQGRGEMGRDLLDRAVEIDKSNYIARAAYMIALQGRWGGSLERMKAFLVECQQARLSPVHLKNLQAMIAEESAWRHQIAGDTSAAVRDYERAAKLKPGESCVPCGPIHKAAELLLANKEYSKAIPLYTKVLNLDPNYIDALNSRGFSELQVGNAQAAVKDLTQAADLGSPYAMDLLGRMYLVGTSIPKNRQKAIEWLRKAAAQGYKPSIEMLPVALDSNSEVLPLPGAPRL